MTGQQLLQLARKHVGERYVLGVLVPKNNPQWRGPWDCAEFISWVAFQGCGKLYGCENNNGGPATADAYTGYWARDAKSAVKSIPLADAVRVPGAAILRIPAAGAMGHIVFSDGQGGTVEAHSTKRGVIEANLADRRWDIGILVPGIQYAQPSGVVTVAEPRTIIVRLTSPYMTGPVVKDIQRALKAAGFHPGAVDGVFGPQTHAAVVSLQAAKGLIADGEVGPRTARALGITLPETT